MLVAVDYQYLTAEECEELKRNAHGRHPWGSYGPAADQPLNVRTLEDLDTEHLENILITQRHLSNEYAASILMLLKQRYSKVQS